MKKDSIFLSSLDLKLLTGKTRGKEQHTQLNKMGIQHMVRGDGEVLVSKSHVEKILDGYLPSRINKAKKQPDYGAI